MNFERGQKWPKWPKMVKNGQNGQNGQFFVSNVDGTSQNLLSQYRYTLKSKTGLFDQILGSQPVSKIDEILC